MGFFCPSVNALPTTGPRPATTVTYPVMEAFPTVQGEGLFTGQAAHFIRLGGCDVGCSWCDVKASWDMAAHPHRSVEALVAEALTHPARIAVVTGGEPLLHDLRPLTDALRAAGFRTHLETSGTAPLSGDWHHVCFSPKKFKDPVPGFHLHADELKVIVVNRHDLVWADGHAALVRPDCACLLQPEWDRRDAVMPLIVAKVMAEPRWRISLQTHKTLNIP
ncbi:MAG: 7-carboxy-7-deazaguanine synthase [Flavobacteriales bacterium]|nr:7-carboxy-7-deazaguanine synthase [Flavobacteriales bacterium]